MFASHLVSIINYYFRQWVMQNSIGYVTGEQGSYIVSGERYAPDVAFILKSRQPQLAKRGYNPNSPVEVDFPSTYES